MGLIAPPLDIDDVAGHLAAASAAGRPVELVGSGCHAGRGATVTTGAELVRAPSGVVTHEPADLTCTVRGGTTLAELSAVLAGAGQELPVDGIPGQATIGGTLAAGVSSRRRLRIGLLRDRVLQVRVVTGDGRVVKAGGPTVKNVSGFDVCRLVCGSLGTLGLIAEVILKVTPRPSSSVWLSCPVGSAAEGVGLGTVVVDSLYDPAVVEVAGPPWRVDVMLEGHAGDVAAQIKRLPEGFGEVSTPSMGPEALEATVPPASLGRLLEGSGDGGVRAQVGVGLAWFASAERAGPLRAVAESYGGRLHTLAPVAGIDPFGSVPPGVEVMRRLREACDPAGILNRGRIPWLLS